MADEDPAYTDRVRLMPCEARGLPGHQRCTGVIEAHHAGSRLGPPVKGRDRRAHDHTAIPLCHGDHMALHASAPPFDKMGRAGKREWQDEKIELTWTRLRRYASIPRESYE